MHDTDKWITLYDATTDDIKLQHAIDDKVD